MWRISLTIRLRLLRHHLNQHAHAAWAVALEHHFVERFAFELPCAAQDRAFDIVIGHVFVLGGADCGAQARVGDGIAAAGARSDGELADNLGEDFATLGVRSRLLMLDRGPF